MTTFDGTSPEAGGTAPPSEIVVSSSPARQASVASVEVDGEGVLLDEASGSRQLLDPMAHLVWSFLDGSATLEELAADLSDVYRADPVQVENDVVNLARRLAEIGFLQPDDATAEALRPPAPASNGDHRPEESTAPQPRFLDRLEST